MTEAEWLKCGPPGPMLDYILPNASARKARLWGCGYMRGIWDRLKGREGSRQGVEVSERYADGKVSLTELRQAHTIARETAEGWSDPAWSEPVWQAEAACAENAFEFLTMARWETTEEF